MHFQRSAFKAMRSIFPKTQEKLGETGREPKVPKSNQSHVAFILFYILMLSSIDSLGGNYLKHWQGQRL
jgi:hypothetical protein